MTANVGFATMQIIPSLKGMSNSLKGATTESKSAGLKSGRVFGSTFAKTSAGPLKSVIGLVGGPMLAAFAGIASIGALKGFISDARESAKIGRLTAKVIETTGGAAQITADQVGNLATAISNKTGADDEAIQSGANLLLTFTNIRNEAGKGNDVFNQATQTITDMSAALGQDMKGSAIQLGKALNDPIKGVTALSRVGVSFTAQQKKQIETLVKSGDTLGAQKVILAELGKEFGGAAAAAGDPMEKLKTQLGNVSEAIGGQLIPVVDGFANFLVGQGIPALTRFGGIARDAFIELKKRAAPVLAEIVARVREFEPIAVAAFQRAAAVVVPFVTSLAAQLLPALTAVGAFISDHISPILSVLGGAFGGALLAAVGSLALALGGSLVAALISITAALAAPAVVIGALVGAVIYAYTHFEAFRVAVAAVATFLQTSVLPALQVVGDYISQKFAEQVAFARDIWPQLQEAISHALNGARDVIQQFIAFFRGAWNLFGVDIVNAARTAFATVRTVIDQALLIIQNIIRLALDLINGDWGKAWNDLKAIVTHAFLLVKAEVTGGMELAKTALSAALTGLSLLFKLAWDALEGVVRAALVLAANAAKAGIEKVVDQVKALPAQITAGLGNLGSLLLQAGADVVQGLVNGIRGAAGRVADAARDLASHIPGPLRKLLGIASPSKVTAKIGQYVIDGLVNSLEAGKSTVADTVSKLAKLIKDNLSGAAESKALATLNGRAKALTAAGTALDKASDRVSTARQKLADALAAKADYAASITEALKASVGLTNALSTDSDTPDSAKSITDYLSNKLAALKSFRDDLAELTKRGVSESILRQVADAGLGQGSTLASLLKTNDAAGLAQLNSLQAQIDSVSTDIGTTTSNTVFADDIAPLTRGLAEQLAEQKRANTTLDGLAAATGAAVVAGLRAGGVKVLVSA